MKARIEEKENFYATKSLIEYLTGGKCQICKEKMSDDEKEEIISQEKYKEAGICRKCRKKLA